MAFRKILLIGSLSGALVSTSAFAAAGGVRASDTGLAARRLGVSLGSGTRAAAKQKNQSSIASSTLLFGAIAGVAVVAGVVAISDNGGSH